MDSTCCSNFSNFAYQLLTMEKDKTIEQLLVELRQFTHERDWEQFHNGKDLALALSIEAAEVNQLFLWKSPENVNIEKLQDELADVLNYAFMLADKYNFDIESIMRNKMIKNGEKYPIEKAKGNAKKYNEF
jgi:NTP pyrophosphatase (non-canonical NTP hydrolase)